MNILILNWRDPQNPKSGGAEKLNMHILKPFLDKGDSVIWYAMAVKGLPGKEQYKGLTIIRFGNPFSHLLLWPFFYWNGKFGKVDFIIDSIHGTGYISSLIAPGVRKKILICEVAQNIWGEMYPFPVSKIGKVWEKIMFKFYKNDTFWTISESTKKDLISFGAPAKNITVLPMGFDALALKTKPKKYENPTALFVGRLAEMKGVKDAIRAIVEVNKLASKKWTLNIIGRGEEKYEKELQRLAAQLKSTEYVHFLGYVDEKKKLEEMARSWILLVPSSREGWGMIVPEANYMGTPAIGYDSSGLSEVLKKYSAANRIVQNTPNALSKELNNITRPLRLVKTLDPSWSELYRAVLTGQL